MAKLFVLLIMMLSYTIGMTQSLNQEVIDDRGRAKLLGLIDKDGLSKPAYAEWFNKNYKDYDVNTKVVKKIKDSLQQYTIKVFLGTWCGDSKREVPIFYNILESANFPEDQLQVYALDNEAETYKRGPNGEEIGMYIHRVPTFIFYKDDKEVNRIVERPKSTLERDILAITTTDRYSANYPGANYMQTLLTEKSVDSVKQNEKKLLPWLAEVVKGSRELNTLGYIFLRSNQFEKAHYIFSLNTKLFPYSSRVFDSLGEAHFLNMNYSEALKNYYKVLSINPEDENAKEMITEIESKLTVSNPQFGSNSSHVH